MRFAGSPKIVDFLNRKENYADIGDMGLITGAEEEMTDIMGRSQIAGSELQADAMKQSAKYQADALKAGSQAKAQASMVGAGLGAVGSLFGGMSFGGSGSGASGGSFGDYRGLSGTPYAGSFTPGGTLSFPSF